MSGATFSRIPWRRVINGAWLLVLWLGITGSWTTGSLVGGIVVVTLLMVLFPPVEPGTTRHRLRPVMLARYAGHFVRELVLANIQVAFAVIFPSRVRHARGVIDVELPPSSRLVLAILANAVSLTPGTSIIDVSSDPPWMRVHVLELRDPDEVRSAIAELHWRLVRALGPEDQLEQVTAHAAELRRVVEGDRSEGSAL